MSVESVRITKHFCVRGTTGEIEDHEAEDVLRHEGAARLEDLAIATAEALEEALVKIIATVEGTVDINTRGHEKRRDDLD